MSENLIINVDLDLILKTGLSIQDFLFLQLIKSGKKELMNEYHSMFGMILNKEGVDRLIKKGFLIKKSDNLGYVFANFQTTDDFNSFTTIKAEDAIEDIKNTYPKKTPSGNRVGLQSDSAKWGPKYLSIIKKDRALHQKILRCIEAEKQHRKKSNSEEYWALLLTYVNNKRWEVYIDDIDNFNSDDNVFSKDI